MEGTLALLIPIIAVGAPFVIAAIAIFTKHQRSMAELFAQNSQNVQVDTQVRQELAELRSLVTQQTIALDNLSRSVDQLRAQQSTELADRLRTGA